MTLTFSKVKVRLHWGFSVAYPATSKAKRSTILPPPTTLIGALSYGEYRGVDSLDFPSSPAEAFNSESKASSQPEKVICAAARFDDDSAVTYSEDVIRNVTSYFQKPERRNDERYIFNIVPTGKVYGPNATLRLVYVTTIPPDKLYRLSWSIVRLGSKEGLVSVEDVEVGEAKETSGNLETKYYFPETVEHKTGPVVLANFWKGGFVWGEKVESVRYVIPLNPFPISSTSIEVNAKRAYEVGGEYVVVE
ncbi:type I-A CRISPR-associated protein Cas5a [Metallosphaera cuprina]|uniref:CRISPR-associated Cas5 family protein n=1 Tax=Metallosphaera cuprina (strain Ar-4) TaxID=1006006 RepID=F4G359_METCR|nr:type I-A CRISPR-associated protein Cas5a [Metallosphaera cuprina]AEB95257.1 CRISPR-associated Cas5 family protein [Metallosphaera cuprina Ar-4]